MISTSRKTKHQLQINIISALTVVHIITNRLAITMTPFKFCFGDDIRRWTSTSRPSLSALVNASRDLFSLPDDIISVRLTYIDQDGDMVSVMPDR